MVAEIRGEDLTWLHTKRKSCIVTCSSMAFDWLQDPAAASGYRIAEEGDSVQWPHLSKSIPVRKLLSLRHVTAYFLRWNKAARRDHISKAELATCWLILGGYRLLHPGGMVRIKLVGRGTAEDLAGDWRWSMRSPREFLLTRHDVDDEDELAFRQVITVSRYDGRILELVNRSFFDRDPAGFAAVQLWKRSKLPKSWQQWA